MSFKILKERFGGGSKPLLAWPDHGVVIQAWTLFVLSAFFAVLFNAFYTDGIELKVFPKKVRHLSDIQNQEPSQTSGYSGWEKPRPVTAAKIKSPALEIADKVPRLSLGGVENRFDKKTCVFLDARKPEEYQEGHIPGALNFYGNELDSFAPLIVPKLTDKKQEIIAYCHGGDCDLSLQVAKTLIEQGYTHVEIFQGGWPDWKKSGYPITRGDNP